MKEFNSMAYIFINLIVVVIVLLGFILLLSYCDSCEGEGSTVIECGFLSSTMYMYMCSYLVIILSEYGESFCTHGPWEFQPSQISRFL